MACELLTPRRPGSAMARLSRVADGVAGVAQEGGGQGARGGAESRAGVRERDADVFKRDAQLRSRGLELLDELRQQVCSGREEEGGGSDWERGREEKREWVGRLCRYGVPKYSVLRGT